MRRSVRALVAALVGLPLFASVPSVASGPPTGRLVVSQLLLFDNPDGGSKAPCGWHQLWRGNAGGAFEQLTRLGGGESYGDYFAPTVSPDGRWLAYATKGGQVAVAPLDLGGGMLTGAHRLLDLGRGAGAPTAVAWSPRGNSLALLQGFAHKGVWVITRDGRGLRRIAPGRMIDVYAGYGVSWSQSGTIAFPGQVDQHSAIFAVRPDGRGLRQLSDPGRDDDGQPAFSPDGTRLAFMRGGDIYEEPGAIELMNVRGGAPRRIGSGVAPVFSPDGRRVAFAQPADLNLDRGANLRVYDTAVRRAESLRLPDRLATAGFLDALTWLG